MTETTYCCHACIRWKKGEPANYTSTGRPTCPSCEDVFRGRRGPTDAVRRATYRRSKKKYLAGKLPPGVS